MVVVRPWERVTAGWFDRPEQLHGFRARRQGQDRAMAKNYTGVDLSLDWLDVFDPQRGACRITNSAVAILPNRVNLNCRRSPHWGASVSSSGGSSPCPQMSTIANQPANLHTQDTPSGVESEVSRRSRSSEL